MIGIFVIDIDDDLGSKAKIQAPIVGVENCKIAGTKMLLSDPEDPDGNTIFKAIEVYDNLEEKDKIIAIITGDPRLGFYAYKKINEQLDKIVERYGIDKAILVTDGLSDENDVIPILASRNIKIIQVVRLNIKQSNRIENTYVFLMNKLKDPYYSKLIFGIPGAIILMFSISLLLGINLSILTALFGFLLIIYGLNFHQTLKEVFEINEINLFVLIPIIMGIVVFIGLLAVSYNIFQTIIAEGEDEIYALFRAFEIVFYWIVALVIFINIIWIITSNDNVKTIRSLQFFIMVSIIFINTFLMINFITNSIIYITFDDIIIYGLMIASLGLIFIEYLENYIKAYIAGLNIQGYRVVQKRSKISLGIVTGIDEDGIDIQTDYKENIRLRYSDIIGIGEKIIYVKY